MNKMIVNYWSKTPGRFVFRDTGKEHTLATQVGPFFGDASFWYQTLYETINVITAELGSSNKYKSSLPDDILLTKEVLDNLKSVEIFKNKTKVGEVIILD